VGFGSGGGGPCRISVYSAFTAAVAGGEFGRAWVGANDSSGFGAGGAGAVAAISVIADHVPFVYGRSGVIEAERYAYSGYIFANPVRTRV